MPNIRMLTAQRELVEKEKLKQQGTVKARRTQENDVQDVAKKTNSDESARAVKKASRDASVAAAEIALADKKAQNAAVGAALGAIGALVSIAASFAKAELKGKDDKPKDKEPKGPKPNDAKGGAPGGASGKPATPSGTPAKTPTPSGGTPAKTPTPSGGTPPKQEKPPETPKPASQDPKPGEKPADTPKPAPGEPSKPNPEGKPVSPTPDGKPAEKPAGTPATGTDPAGKPVDKPAKEAKSEKEDGGPTKKEVQQFQAYVDLFDALRQLGGKQNEDFKLSFNAQKAAQGAQAFKKAFTEIGQNFKDVGTDIKNGVKSSDPASAASARKRERNEAEGKDGKSRSEAETDVQAARAKEAKAESGTVDKLNNNQQLSDLSEKATKTPAALTDTEVASLEKAGVKFTTDDKGKVNGVVAGSIESARQANALNDNDRRFIQRNGLTLDGDGSKGTVTNLKGSNVEKNLNRNIALQYLAIKADKGEAAATLFLAENKPEFLLKGNNTIAGLDKVDKTFAGARDRAEKLGIVKDGAIQSAEVSKVREQYNSVNSIKGESDRFRADDQNLLTPENLTKPGFEALRPSNPESPAPDPQATVYNINDAKLLKSEDGKLTGLDSGRVNLLKDGTSTNPADKRSPGSGEAGSLNIDNSTGGKSFGNVVGTGALKGGLGILTAFGRLIGADVSGLTKAKDNVDDLGDKSKRKNKYEDFAETIEDSDLKKAFLEEGEKSGYDITKATDNLDAARYKAEGKNLEDNESVVEAKNKLNEVRGPEGQKTDVVGAKAATISEIKEALADKFGSDKDAEDKFNKYFEVDKTGVLSLKSGQGDKGFFEKIGSSVSGFAKDVVGKSRDANLINDINSENLSNADAAKIIDVLNKTGNNAVIGKILTGVGEDKAGAILNAKDSKLTGDQSANTALLDKIGGDKTQLALNPVEQKKAIQLLFGSDKTPEDILEAVKSDPKTAGLTNDVITDGKLDVNKFLANPAIAKAFNLESRINNAKDKTNGNVIDNGTVVNILRNSGLENDFAQSVGAKVANGITQNQNVDANGVVTNKGSAIGDGDARAAKVDLDKQIGGSKIKPEKLNSFNYSMLVFNVGLPALQFMLQQLDKMREAQEQGLEAKKKLAAANKLLADLGKDLRRQQGSANGTGADVPQTK